MFLFISAYNDTHYTFTLDCTHEDSTWVIVENGKIQFTEERQKAKIPDRLQTWFKHMLQEVSSSTPLYIYNFFS